MKSFCLINLLHSDLVLLESQGGYSQSAILTWYAMFCFNGVPSFLEKKKSKDPEKYFCNRSSCSSQHERTQLVLELYSAYCGLRPAACGVQGIQGSRKQKQKLGTKSHPHTAALPVQGHSTIKMALCQQNKNLVLSLFCLFAFVIFSVFELVGTVIFRVMSEWYCDL